MLIKPKKDICKICSEYENATEEAKLQLQQQYESHIKNKNIVREIKNKEKDLADQKLKTVAVFDLEKANFYNFKSQVTSLKNWIHDTNGNKVLFSKIKEIKACPDTPNKLFFKYDFENHDYLVLDTTNRTSSRTRKTNISPQSLNELMPAYDKCLPISNALYKDLISLCDTNAIPLHYQGFYRNLVTQSDTPNLEIFDTSDED
ncbi:unnamed protein product [Parnassius mnemosyne]|uniref:Uncharacterized protein n=1 Tax=Parnassius mnemosyne TaxID=213953 RepID=A0AAV1KXT4_9NEOP